MSRGLAVVSLVSNAIYSIRMRQAAVVVWGAGGEEKRSRVMASPPFQEVDDINKKLIILPQATSEGVCQSNPLQSTHSPSLHISHSLHPQKTIGWIGGEKTDGK